MTAPELTAADVALIRRQGDLGPYLRGLVADARRECALRRVLVLAHPDLAARLIEPPISFSAPDRWTGFVPPELHHGARNASPVRAALLELVAEAERRAAFPAPAAYTAAGDTR